MASTVQNNPLFEQFYNFPPFFTLQPTPQTRTNQLDLWTKVLQSTCKQSRQFIVTRNEQIFTNPGIKRSLSNDFITELFNYMVQNHTALPNTRSQDITASSSPGSPTKAHHHGQKKNSSSVAPLDSVIVMFLPKEKWYEKLYDYAKRNGLIGGIATAYEILNDEEFQGMDSVVLEVLLRGMMKDLRNCEVMGGAGGGIDGVKFF